MSAQDTGSDMTSSTEEAGERTFRGSAWYRAALNDLRSLIDSERITLLRTKHQVGLRILRIKEELIEQDVVTNDRGWSGVLGDLMQRLSDDLEYSLAELYDALKFVQRFPKWSDFANREFEVTRQRGGVSYTARISGKDLSWHQVVGQVFYPRQIPTEKGKESLAVCIFKSEACGGDTKKIEICGHHFGDFVVWMNQRKLKLKLAREKDG